MKFAYSVYMLFTLFVLALSFPTSASTDSNKVYVFEINEEIAEPVWHNLKKAFLEANSLDVNYFIIDMNTYGGKVDMADSIRTAILRSKIPVFMLINNNAASAGALISIACKYIYMTPGATIGAATVVTENGAPAIDKYQSYFRSKMRATAEVTNRDPDIAEAMVDQDIEIEGVTKKGKLLTFTVKQALEFGFCESEVKNMSELLELNDLQDAEIIHYTPSTIDVIISILINPAFSGVLIMVMMGGIYFELQSPGIGFPIAAAAVSAVLFFLPLYIEGLAQNWEMIVFVLGIIAIAAEVFIIPGTGITGVLGIVLVISGLTLSMVNNIDLDFSMVRLDGLFTSLSVVLLAMLFMAILTIVMLPKILSSGRLNDLVLSKSIGAKDGFIGIDQNILKTIGKKGVVISDLRPSGKILIEDNHFDAISISSYINKGESIEVINTDGAQLTVRKI